MSSGFISETEAADLRKKRQEEWERVRKPSDPVVRPEEPYDNRSLYEKLQEQKQKKDLEYEEAHKLKNLIKGLDDDEIEFLDLVDRTKLAADRKKEIEEEQELKDYRNRVAILQEKSAKERLQAEKIVNSKPKHSGSKNLNQQKLLTGVVVKKTSVKRKMEPSSNETSEEDKKKETSNSKQQKMEKPEQGDSNSVNCDNSGSNQCTKVINPPAFKCVAILPGLGSYEDSSSDENSSDSESSEIDTSGSSTDLLGRKRIVVKSSAQSSK